MVIDNWIQAPELLSSWRGWG